MIILTTILSNIKHRVFLWLFSEDDARIMLRAIQNQVDSDKSYDNMVDFRITFTNDYTQSEELIKKIEEYSCKREIVISLKSVNNKTKYANQRKSG